MQEGPYSKMTATERGKMMLRLADLVAKNVERLAEIEVRDNGKLLAEMRGQVNHHPEWWRYYGGLADKIELSCPLTTVRLKVEQIQLVSGVKRFDLGCIGLQGA